MLTVACVTKNCRSKSDKNNLNLKYKALFSSYGFICQQPL